MTEFKEHLPGTFCFAELGTSDQQRAGTFYQALFDWGRADQDRGEAGVYTRFTRDGLVCAAMYELSPVQTGQGMTSQWFQYVTVDDADTASERAQELGGTVLAGPLDIMEHGRLAVLRATDQSVVCVWQPRRTYGVAVKDADGAMCWNELISADLGAAREFYGSLFGWEHRHTLEAGRPYTVCYGADGSAAGMLDLPVDMMDVPNHWLVYFAVADCDAAAARAAELGGRALVEPTNLPTVGRFAILQDPCDGVFGVVDMDGYEEGDEE
ncbi:MAG: VOC family protein [bacterium]|nr:VOC family protein [bacterium]